MNPDASPDKSESPTRLVQRWKAGDQRAAQLLYDRYAARLARLAASKMEQRLQRRLSGEDIVQSAFTSFFKRAAENKLHVENAKELWNLLVTITISKMRSKSREHRALKRTIAAEAATEQADWLLDELARDPSPSEAAILVEQLEKATEDLSEKHREILSLRMAGHSRTEIAEMLKLSRQTIYRVLRLIEHRLHSLAEE